MCDCWLSVVIPAYNETGRIGATLQALQACAAAAGRPYEAIVVDDGSTDSPASE